MIRDSILWRKQYFGGYTILSFCLLYIALGSVALGITSLVPDLDPGRQLLISFVAVLLTWQLARTTFNGWVSGLLLIAFGALLIFLWTGSLWPLIIAWLREVVGYILQILGSRTVFTADSGAYWVVVTEIELRSATLINELGNWLRAIISRSPIYSFQVINMLWGYGIWLVSAWAAWYQRRSERPLLAIIPASLLLVGSLGYTYGSTVALYPLIFATLSLFGLTFYHQRERSWKLRNMDYPIEERSENIFLIFGITFGFMFAAVLIPRISIRSVIDTFRNWINPGVEQIDPLLESFGLMGDLTPPGSMGHVLEGGLPREHLIGSGPELSDQIVMSVHLRTDVAENGFSPTEYEKLGIPFYWRAITYDRYTGFGWESSDVVLRTYAPNEPTYHPKGENVRILGQEFQFVEPNELIFAAGEILALDTDYRIAWRVVSSITETLDAPIDLFAGSQNERTYRVDSAVSLVSEDELNATQALYPSWISERYLALPEAVQQRVIDLAREVTRNAPTSYAKAHAIETYLRTFKYELNLPAPPENRELSDYFLFELQKGYCDYYATSMVVMARAVGIPARLAIGYSQGSYDPDQQEFTVAEDNAHSWVEIYFTGIGWVPFEPTAARNAIQRPVGSVDTPPVVSPALQTDIPGKIPEIPAIQWWYWLGGILFGMAILPMIWVCLDGWYLRFLSPSRMTTRLYHRLYRFGSTIDTPAQRGQTAIEYADVLAANIHELSKDTRWKSMLQTAAEDVQTLSQVYVSSIFSPDSLPYNHGKQIISSWQRLRIRLIFIRMLYNTSQWRTT